ncbi:MAG TPA: LysM domain-containing protein [Kiritimatiellia bacterium]|nr:LysM domain-containing protein [Kiritimatiellia bacterium]HRZ11979.1 LysM domain-containing protein [Kiritimatiellia bacterium]HSA17215.1 LysM domain-containing protein [Kiritimatiellia bacterium]
MKQAWIVAAAGLSLAGCVTYDDAQREAAAGHEDYLLVQEQMRRLDGRLEGVELEISRLQTNLETLRAGQSRADTSETQAIQARVEDLDRRLRALDAARQQDKQEIVDSLSKKIAQLVGSASSGSSAKKQSGSRKSGPSTGYEHEVQPGESLSAIAAAYGVSSKVIMEDNGITDPDKLRVGQKLFIRD